MKAWALWIGFALIMVQSPPVGNGSISGVIVESTTGAPIEDVEVSVERKTATTPPFKTVRMITDELGRFEISGLPAGRYRIHWERQGFHAPRNVRGDEIRITTRSGCCSLNVSGRGRSVYANPGVEVDVDGTQATKKLSLSLVAGGVISGRVLDPRGEPLAGGNITALTIFYEYGSPVLHVAGQATTNDRGRFRLWGLKPGKYYIRAESRRDSEGRFTYFPGVPNAGTAGAIAVASGGEFRGADFNIQP